MKKKQVSTTLQVLRLPNTSVRNPYQGISQKPN